MSEKSDNAAQVQAMLEVMWKNSRLIVAERVRTLRHAQQSIVEGTLDVIARKDAESEAHKLAGILGTFGLPQGSAIALKIEHLMAQQREFTAWQQNELANWLDGLEIQINSKDEYDDPRETAI